MSKTNIGGLRREGEAKQAGNPKTQEMMWG